MMLTIEVGKNKNNNNTTNNNIKRNQSIILIVILCILAILVLVIWSNYEQMEVKFESTTQTQWNLSNQSSSQDVKDIQEFSTNISITYDNLPNNTLMNTITTNQSDSDNIAIKNNTDRIDDNSSNSSNLTSKDMFQHISPYTIDCATYMLNASTSRRIITKNYPGTRHANLSNAWYYVGRNHGDPTFLMDLILDEMEINSINKHDTLFIDVGANLGLFTLAALTLGIRTIAIEPVMANLVDLCHAWRRNVEQYPNLDTSLLTIIKAAVVEFSEPNSSIIISKPQWVDKQDQASLFSNTIGVVRKPVLEYETVPTIRLDDIFTPTLSSQTTNNNNNNNTTMFVAMIKIDVQGAEPLVLRGMKNLLERSVGYPTHVFYEEQPSVIVRANITNLGDNQRYLESYGYNCTPFENDRLCSKYQNGM
jgi:FkbM family methyltransferase